MSDSRRIELSKGLTVTLEADGSIILEAKIGDELAVIPLIPEEVARLRAILNAEQIDSD